MNKWTEIIKVFLLGIILALLLLNIRSNKQPTKSFRYSLSTIKNGEGIIIFDQDQGIVKLFALGGAEKEIVTYKFNRTDTTIIKP